MIKLTKIVSRVNPPGRDMETNIKSIVSRPFHRDTLQLTA